MTSSDRGTPTSGRRFVAVALALVLLVAWPHLPFLPHTFRVTFLGDAILAMSYTMVAASLVLLTGWVGQISLAQASFVGIGAFATGLIVRGTGLAFPLTLPVAALVAALVAAGLGFVALRVRGLYLAVATLIFAWMTDAWLFLQPWFLGEGGSSSIPWSTLGLEGTFPFVDFTDRGLFYYVMLATTAATLIALANLRDSKSGRAFFAVRGSEVAAASLGIDVSRTKLLAFAASGFIAGAVGNLNMTHDLVASPSSFTVQVSLLFLAIAVVGGLTSLGGTIAAGVLFAALAEVFFRVDALAGMLEIVSALLLAFVLLFFPRGLAGIPRSVRAALSRAADSLNRWTAPDVAADPAAADGPDEQLEEPVGSSGWLGRVSRTALRPVFTLFNRVVAGGSPRPALASLGDTPDALAVVEELAQETSDEQVEASPSGNGHKKTGLEYVPGTAERPELPPREERRPLLVADDVTVRFGGLTAVDQAHLEVREGEIVGLIGPNGAGKTTLFNAIAGLNEPDTGRIEMFGRDVSGLPVHVRARMGVGRTFQIIQLFPQLDVFDNLLVATHMRTPTGFFSHLIASSKAAEAESKSLERVERVIDALGLEEHRSRNVAELPFGVLRRIEVARALVTGSPLIMLDEPASGLDNTETDQLADLLLWLRDKLGISLLLIEHDVRMVTGVSDHMYVLDRGAIIGEGTPEEVQEDEAVINAYLGTETAPVDDTIELETTGVSG